MWPILIGWGKSAHASKRHGADSKMAIVRPSRHDAHPSPINILLRLHSRFPLLSEKSESSESFCLTGASINNSSTTYVGDTPRLVIRSFNLVFPSVFFHLDFSLNLCRF